MITLKVKSGYNKKLNNRFLSFKSFAFPTNDAVKRCFFSDISLNKFIGLVN